MLPIQMVDLKGQYIKIKEEINLAMLEVLERSDFIQGSQVKKFESGLASFNRVKHCISCANGTDALQIAIMALGLKTGDEVIVPAFTYIATAEVAALLGLKVILADVDPGTFTLSPESVRNSISPKTKLIVPVHLFGQSADMETILAIAREHKLYVIEDAAQAIGSEYTFSDGKKMFAGTMGTIGITSFFPSKNLGCYGDGGALYTNDDALSKKIRMIGNHGQEKKYYHDIIGINSRLDTIQAGVLDVKLRYLDKYIEERQKVASFYDNAFNTNSSFETPKRNPSSTHVFHQYTLRLKNENRESLKKYLETKKIPSMVYYPLPIHFQKAYQSLGYATGDFPVSETLAESVISLPIHTEMDKEQLSYITENIINFFK